MCFSSPFLFTFQDHPTRLHVLCNISIFRSLSRLYILRVTNIFPWSVAYLFHSLNRIFCRAKDFYFDISPFIFCFCFPCLNRSPPKKITKTNIKACTAVFFKKICGFFLTLKPLIHFEFILVHGVREESSLILLHVAVHSPSTICWRGCQSPIV